MVGRERTLASYRHYMTHDGKDAVDRSGDCDDGWVTLGSLHDGVADDLITAKDARALVKEGLKLFGDCPESSVAQELLQAFGTEES